MKRRYLLLVLILTTTFRLAAQEWIVPAENATKLSPFAFSDSTRKTGADLYTLNCKSCHGDPGKNNAMKLVPPPPDPASAKMQANTDGSLYFKLTEGRGTMPSFKNILGSKDIWRVVSYIRSFNDKYIQEVEKKLLSGSSAEAVKLVLSWIKDKNQIQASVSGVKDSKRQPIQGAEVKLFAKRYFGNLAVDQPRSSDLEGKVVFNFPSDLPGDSTGFVQITAKLTDEGSFGEAKADTSLAIGVATYRAPLNEPRAMWNVVQKTPIWLLLSYTITVLGVWAFIIYVVLQIRAISKAGEDKSTSKEE